MGEKTGIAWTDHTFNCWWGCTEVSPACDNCYAKIVDARFSTVGHWGKGVPRRKMSDRYWEGPLKWDQKAREAGKTARVFCASMADVMDDEAPEGQRERLWELIDRTPNLLWLLLTKRPHRYSRYLPKKGSAHPNVMLGTTVESQEFYKVRITQLQHGCTDLESHNDLWRSRGATVKSFISYEPALGPLSIRDYPGLRPHWVIFGGETGANPRPVQLEWAENIKRECEEFGVAFFMKQLSARTPELAAQLIPPSMLVRQFPA